MANSLIQYVYSCTNAMFNYLRNGEDLDALITDLERIQNHAKQTIGGKDSTLWFKFGSDDTLATDINDIRNDLSTKGGNRNLLLDKMESVIGLDVDSELRVFYS